MKILKSRRLGIVCLLGLSLAADSALAKTSKALTDSLVSEGTVSQIEWSEDGRWLDFVHQNHKVRFDLSKGEEVSCQAMAPDEIQEFEQKKREARRARYRRYFGMAETDDPRIQRPGRGRQYMIEKSPDGQWYALCEEWNVVLEAIPSGEKRAVTTSGNRKYRFGTANWVWGEEIAVKHGMWWTPDSKKLIYYVFDERPVRDFHLVSGWTELYTRPLVEGYTKAGDPNARAALEIYDLETGVRTPVACGGEYIFEMRFTPDGKELLFNRTDRHQRHLEVMALNVETGELRRVVEEAQETWQENHPLMHFLKDGQRFIWETEKSGYRHYELRHLDGRLINPLTRGDYPAMSVKRVDEKNGWLYYTANSDAANPLLSHLFRVKLTGKGRKQLTTVPLNHTDIQISPDGRWIIDRYESVATPPETVLLSSDGKSVAVLAQGADFENDRSELFHFTASDGRTEIYGILHKPENFDESKSYPLIVAVYGGPDSRAVHDQFMRGHRMYSQDYLIVQTDNRGTSGRGKAFKAAVYRRLGDVDIQDQADAVRFLRQRPYVDGNRVGITGHSYGGYMSIMAMLKHPDVFTASVALAAPVNYRQYDSIWSERFLSLPQDSPRGYEAGDALKLAHKLEGHLLLMHGMADDNVHPNNFFQMTEALNAAGKHALYETRLFPNSGHVYFGREFQDAFFEKHLEP